MTRSELIQIIGDHIQHLSRAQVELAMKLLIRFMGDQLKLGRRIEIRGFGCFSVRYRKGRKTRNPKTGEIVETKGRYLLHFKPGKALKEAVNASYLRELEEA